MVIEGMALLLSALLLVFSLSQGAKAVDSEVQNPISSDISSEVEEIFGEFTYDYLPSLGSLCDCGGTMSDTNVPGCLCLPTAKRVRRASRPKYGALKPADIKACLKNQIRHVTKCLRFLKRNSTTPI